MNIKSKKFLIPVVIGLLIVAGVFVFLNPVRNIVSNGVNQEIPSSQEIAQKAVNYINQNNMLPEGLTASLLDVGEENGLYKIHIKIAEEEYYSYATKDGKLFFPQSIDLEEASSPSQEEESSGELPKRDIPDVKVFVMSYCPFGLQAQKMFLPVYNLLNERTEMGIYFVDYIMHDKEEINENLRQYCIQKEEKENYGNYLSCFVEDGDFEKCLSVANIDRTKLAACISTTDEEYNITAQYNNESTWIGGSYPKFDVHSDLNEKYGVGGSPTVVINDQVVNINPRSPENFKEVICQSFTSLPQECSQVLSNDVPSSGFGLETGSSSGGACQ